MCTLLINPLEDQAFKLQHIFFGDQILMSTTTFWVPVEFLQRKKEKYLYTVDIQIIETNWLEQIGQTQNSAFWSWSTLSATLPAILDTSTCRKWDFSDTCIAGFINVRDFFFSLKIRELSGNSVMCQGKMNYAKMSWKCQGILHVGLMKLECLDLMYLSC